jgi:hypothetical protein
LPEGKEKDCVNEKEFRYMSLERWRKSRFERLEIVIHDHPEHCRTIQRQTDTVVSDADMEATRASDTTR